MAYHVPKLGDLTPARGNHLSRAFGRTLLKCTGWKLAGEIPNVPKAIFIGAPHTSNWDFPIAITVLFLVDYRVRFLLGFDLELVDLVRLFIELDALLAHVRAGGADAVLLSRTIVLLLKLATVAVLLLLLIAALVDQFL